MSTALVVVVIVAPLLAAFYLGQIVGAIRMRRAALTALAKMQCTPQEAHVIERIQGEIRNA